MANPVAVIKTATSVLAASAALLAALKENPQIGESVKGALDKVKGAASSKNPKVRFDGKLAAIEACADAVEAEFPGSAEVTSWRQAAASLRMRGALIWSSEHGRKRKKSMAALNEETSRLLASINERLAGLTLTISSEATRDLPKPE